MAVQVRPWARARVSAAVSCWSAFRRRRARRVRCFPRVSPKAFATMWNDLIDGDPTHQILSAWIAKEELRGLLDQLAGLFAGWGVMTNVVPDSPAHLPGSPTRPWMS